MNNKICIKMCCFYGNKFYSILFYSTFHNPNFYGKYHGNMFILIWNNQDCLERREEHPGGVQQDKT